MAGKVFLVGGGPGDPDLLTNKAEKVLRKADVVLHDALIGKEMVDLLPELSPGEIINCGKRKGDKKLSQSEINKLMLERAQCGQVVVRLKGGDPFVFGRGGEEMKALKQNGVEVEVIPGITSAIAAPAMANIPLTQRKISSYATLVTGHEDPSKPDSDVNWKDIAKLDGTLVILMGITNLDKIVDILIENGKVPSTPAATIEKATLPGQRIVRARIKDLPERVRRAGLKPPGTTVIGSVAGLSGNE